MSDDKPSIIEGIKNFFSPGDPVVVPTADHSCNADFNCEVDKATPPEAPTHKIVIGMKSGKMFQLHTSTPLDDLKGLTDAMQKPDSNDLLVVNDQSVLRISNIECAYIQKM